MAAIRPNPVVQNIAGLILHVVSIFHYITVASKELSVQIVVYRDYVEILHNPHFRFSSAVVHHAGRSGHLWLGMQTVHVELGLGGDFCHPVDVVGCSKANLKKPREEISQPNWNQDLDSLWDFQYQFSYLKQGW